MQDQLVIVGAGVIVSFILLLITLYLKKRFEASFYKKKLKELEVERNQVASTPVLLELSKVEPIIKNDKMEEKYSEWQDRFEFIRQKRLSVIDDMIIDLDVYVEKKDYKSCGYRIAKTFIGTD